MSQLMNKDGLPVKNNPKAIQEELVRGTGFVIGSNVSAFMLNESINEKYIVVSMDNGIEPPTEKRYILGRMTEALKLFQQRLSGNSE